MGAFFGAVSHRDVALDVFFGVDYHSHLGTRRAGMVTCREGGGFNRQIHSIENTPFRTKFEHDLPGLSGTCGMGCISDNDPQPLLVRSHLGLYAISTVGAIANQDALVARFEEEGHQFMAMGSGGVNVNELVAALINTQGSIVEGIRYAQDEVEGSLTLLIMTEGGELVAARDKMGRLPVLIGHDDDGYCVTFESFAYGKLGYVDEYELGSAEIVRITADGYETLSPARDEMRICAFLWVYYGYPNSTYEGVNVECMRYRNGAIMARDEREAGLLPEVDFVAGMPDSGLPHGIGYANESGVPLARPFVKYTPTWPRSFMPANQEVRNRVAKMKQIPVPELHPRRACCSSTTPSSAARRCARRSTSCATPARPRSTCARPPADHVRLQVPLVLAQPAPGARADRRRKVRELEGDEGEKHLDEYADGRSERGRCLPALHLRGDGLRLPGVPKPRRHARGHRHRPQEGLHLLLERPRLARGALPRP